MEKINFQDLPSTNTPYNAETFNTMQNNIENAIDKSAITITQTLSNSLDTTNPTKLTGMSVYNIRGTDFSLTDDEIVCNKDGYILVSGQVSFITVGDKTKIHGGYIVKNSTAYVARAMYVPTADYTGTPISPILIPVQVGDKIALYGRNQGSTASTTWTSDNQTHLTAMYI